MTFAFLRARMGAVVLAGLFAGTVLAVSPTAASASPAAGTAPNATVSHHHHLTKKQRHHRHELKLRHRYEVKVHKVLHEAAKQRGKPYVYGAAGPHSFDCSGLVMYVFRHAIGKSLPHNAAAQYGVTHHISRKHLRRGDLVFVDNGGYISHVGIYAGRSSQHRYWWVAPHTGEHVHKQPIYHAHFLYGEVLRP
jgi:cell wall-associated NlpC family hydrolase